MAASNTQKQNFINSARVAAAQIWDGWQTLVAQQAEWNALDYSNDLEPEDFTGDNEGLVAANIGSVVFDTANAITTLMGAGHATNVAKIK